MNELTNRIISALQHNFPQFLFLVQMDYDRDEIRVSVSNGAGIQKQFVYNYRDLIETDKYCAVIDEVCDWCRSVLHPKSEPKQIIEKGNYITNCKNCGAPLHGSRCEYCGTEYNLVNGLEAKLNELKFRTANTQQIANIKFGTPIGYKTNSDGTISDYCEGIENCPIIW